jgi:UPF0755 protein
MKLRADKSDIKLWEYPWYALVTLGLLLAGIFLIIMWGIIFVMKSFRPPIVSFRYAIILIVLIFVLSVGYVYIEYSRQTDLGGKIVTVTINTGDKFQKVSEDLKDQGVIPSVRLFRYFAQWRHLDRKLIPGEYQFKRKNSIRSVLEKLEKAEGVQIRITIYEGAPIWKVASIISQRLKIDSTQLIALSKDQAFLDTLGVPSLEGYLFPETYLFAPGVGIRSVVREMVRMFNVKTEELLRKAGAVGLNKTQVITLASIVQAETKLELENGKIASVYLNRLKRGMTLDADPTVIYGLGGLNRPLVKEDLEVNTPYNTYLNGGLPPGPINSPGLAAIQGALFPDTTGYLYFVADGSGAHIFSYTNDEHNEARRRVKIMEQHQ